MAGPCHGGKRGKGLKKTETDLNGRPLSEGKKGDGVCGMTETDLKQAHSPPKFICYAPPHTYKLGDF